MGTVTIQVGDPQGNRFQDLDLIVGTGSTYTAVPRSILENLGVPVRRSLPSETADGRTIPVDVGTTIIKIQGIEIHTPVIFAETNEPGILGVVSLEEATLTVDSATQRLVPTKLLRYHAEMQSITSPPTADMLRNALTELREALENAPNAEIPEPEPAIVEEAQRILREIHRAAPRIYMVSLMPDGTIAIDTRGTKPDGAFITLSNNGTAYCSRETGGKHWRKKYARSECLPDRILLDELKRLGQ